MRREKNKKKKKNDDYKMLEKFKAYMDLVTRVKIAQEDRKRNLDK